MLSTPLCLDWLLTSEDLLLSVKTFELTTEDLLETLVFSDASRLPELEVVFLPLLFEPLFAPVTALLFLLEEVWATLFDVPLLFLLILVPVDLR